MTNQSKREVTEERFSVGIVEKKIEYKEVEFGAGSMLEIKVQAKSKNVYGTRCCINPTSLSPKQAVVQITTIKYMPSESAA